MNPPNRRRLVALAVGFAVLVATPLAVVANDAFTDVPPTNVHHDDITWLKDAAVTLGCNPPDNNEFCPGDNVTRQQMASFLRRLAENQVVDADTAITAASAADANALAGAGPSAYTTVIDGSTCYGSDCPDLPGVTNVELMELEVTAPAAGVLSLDYSGTTEFLNPTNDYTATWMTLNGDEASFDGCETSFLGVPLGDNKVIGSERFDWVDGNVVRANNVANPTVEVPAGTHTVSLCGFSNVSPSVYSLSVTATWSAVGSLSTAGTAGGDAEISAEFEALLEEAQE